MKRYLITFLSVCLCQLPAFASAQYDEHMANIANEVAEKTYTQEELQAIAKTYGYYRAGELRCIGLGNYVNSFIQGINSAANNEENESILSIEEFEQAIATIDEMTHNIVSEENLQEANEFLTSNKENPGIIEMEEGKLQIKILREGKGSVRLRMDGCSRSLTEDEEGLM